MRPRISARSSAVFVDDPERASASLELALVAVVFLMMLMLAAFGWRVTQATGDVGDAAAEGARAASLALGDDAEALAVVESSLGADGVGCRSLSVSVGTSAVSASGGVTAKAVTLNVNCVVDLSDLVAIGVPGSQTISASHTEVIDVYIGGG